MCNVYVNGSPSFKKKKTPNNSHMNVSYLTLIINIFFLNSGSSLNIFHSKQEYQNLYFGLGDEDKHLAFNMIHQSALSKTKVTTWKSHYGYYIGFVGYSMFMGKIHFPRIVLYQRQSRKTCMLFWTYMPMKKYPHPRIIIRKSLYTSSTFSLAEGLLSASLS